MTTGEDDFAFDDEVVARCSEAQRMFLALLSEAVRSIRPALLDVEQVRAGVVDSALHVHLPHRGDEHLAVGARVDDDGAVVYFGEEHEHFRPDDPANGRLWPFDAPDAPTAAFRLIEQLLLGRVELEIEPRRFVTRMRTMWIDDEGNRVRLSRSSTLLPRREGATPEVRRFDFGARPR